MSGLKVDMGRGADSKTIVAIHDEHGVRYCGTLDQAMAHFAFMIEENDNLRSLVRDGINFSHQDGDLTSRFIAWGNQAEKMIDPATRGLAAREQEKKS